MSVLLNIVGPFAGQLETQSARGDWMEMFDEHLQSKGLPYSERHAMLLTAKQFTCWCEARCREGSRVVATFAYDLDGNSEEWTLRETFLREAIPDHDLRHIERARLIRYLNYLRTAAVK